VLLSISRSHDHPYSKSLSQTMTVGAHRGAGREDPIYWDQWLRSTISRSFICMCLRRPDHRCIHLQEPLASRRLAATSKQRPSVLWPDRTRPDHVWLGGKESANHSRQRRYNGEETSIPMNHTGKHLLHAVYFNESLVFYKMFIVS
jgi:hypothetical protein